MHVTYDHVGAMSLMTQRFQIRSQREVMPSACTDCTGCPRQQSSFFHVSPDENDSNAYIQPICVDTRRVSFRSILIAYCTGPLAGPRLCKYGRGNVGRL